MRDFGAGTCDFRSDFHPESNDYASDFPDFPGDFAGGFGGAPRKAKQPPEAPGHRDLPAGAWDSRRQRPRGTRAAASWQRKRQATEQGTTPRHKAINNGHRARGTAVYRDSPKH